MEAGLDAPLNWTSVPFAESASPSDNYLLEFAYCRKEEESLVHKRRGFYVLLRSLFKVSLSPTGSALI
jgi:hypothetical protein